MIIRKVLGHKCQNNFNKFLNLFTIFDTKLYITSYKTASLQTLLCLLVGERALLNGMAEKIPDFNKTGREFFESSSSSS